MRLLLDTHVWIWSAQQTSELGPQTQQLLEDGRNELFVSPISTLEIARLCLIGRISLQGSLLDWVRESLDMLACGTADLSHEVAGGAYRLPGVFHPDPADRILIATARNQRLTLVTADRRILEYAHVDSRDARR
jgi:PIN domain nuclease of toxin-antitoxin system